MALRSNNIVMVIINNSITICFLITIEHGTYLILVKVLSNKSWAIDYSKNYSLGISHKILKYKPYYKHSITIIITNF